jgi:hypothetical protein
VKPARRRRFLQSRSPRRKFNHTDPALVSGESESVYANSTESSVALKRNRRSHSLGGPVPGLWFDGVVYTHGKMPPPPSPHPILTWPAPIHATMPELCNER